MITILHGDDQLSSRRELENMAAAFEGEIVRFDGPVDPTDFCQRLGQSLFGQTLVVMENCLSGKKKFDLEIKEDAQIVFWEGKELGKPVLDQFKKYRPTIKKFAIPQLIWKFCDALKPTNGKYLVPLFRETLKTAEAEFIFAMIIRQFRLMLNPDDLPSWQAAKIRSQAKIFGPEQLKKIYARLLDLDYELKTGQTPFTLPQKIETLLLWI
jgi:hypothetical protein